MAIKNNILGPRGLGHFFELGHDMDFNANLFFFSFAVRLALYQEQEKFVPCSLSV